MIKKNRKRRIEMFGINLKGDWSIGVYQQYMIYRKNKILLNRLRNVQLKSFKNITVNFCYCYDNRL